MAVATGLCKESEELNVKETTSEDNSGDISYSLTFKASVAAKQMMNLCNSHFL